MHLSQMNRTIGEANACNPLALAPPTLAIKLSQQIGDAPRFIGLSEILIK
jgi:hypothetical protein